MSLTSELNTMSSYVSTAENALNNIKNTLSNEYLDVSSSTTFNNISNFYAAYKKYPTFQFKNVTGQGRYFGNDTSSTKKYVSNSGTYTVTPTSTGAEFFISQSSSMPSTDPKNGNSGWIRILNDDFSRSKIDRMWQWAIVDYR